MTDYTVKRLGLILAQQAEIEGMKAQNMLNQASGRDIYYGIGDFQNIAANIEEIVRKADEQL